MKTKKIVVAILLTALLTSCKEESAVIKFEQTDTFKTLSEVKLPKPNQDELTLDSEFVDSTLEVLEKMTKMYYEDTNLENYVVSPMSLYYALSMINNGTSNANENEISKFLSINNMNKANNNLKKHYQNNYLDDKSSQKKISNSLWLKNNFDTNENFVNVLESKYYSDSWSVGGALLYMAHGKYGRESWRNRKNRDDANPSTPSGTVEHTFSINVDGTYSILDNLKLTAGFYTAFKWNYHNQPNIFRTDVQGAVGLSWTII